MLMDLVGLNEPPESPVTVVFPRLCSTRQGSVQWASDLRTQEAFLMHLHRSTETVYLGRHLFRDINGQGATLLDAL